MKGWAMSSSISSVIEQLVIDGLEESILAKPDLNFPYFISIW